MPSVVHCYWNVARWALMECIPDGSLLVFSDAYESALGTVVYS